MRPSVQIVRKIEFKSRPWKNGGGITHDVFRVPSKGDNFDWRLSVAQIDTSGPFSDFAAYHRKMVLLKGTGVQLEFSDGRRQVLRRVGDLVEFDGALATHCTLLEGACVDLNLMVAKSLAVSVSVESVSEARAVQASASRGDTTLFFGLDAALTLRTGSDKTSHLEPWDLAILSNGVATVTRSQNDGSASGMVFLATVGH